MTTAEDDEDRQALAEYRDELAAGELPVPFASVREDLLADDDLIPHAGHE